MHEMPLDSSEHIRIFGVLPRFAASVNALELEAATMSRPILTAAPALSRIIERHAQNPRPNGSLRRSAPSKGSQILRLEFSPLFVNGSCPESWANGREVRSCRISAECGELDCRLLPNRPNSCNNVLGFSEQEASPGAARRSGRHTDPRRARFGEPLRRP